MEQTTPAAPTSTASSLDPQAVNLAKAIRQTESGGNFQAQGKSGEYGAYQFTEPTWNTYAKKHGVNAQLKQATPEQQNEVAYKQIKEWKDQGMNVGQIASMWNSGKPDAYLDSSYSGTNKYGAKYDVPAYVKSVATAYQTLKNGGQVTADPNNPSSTSNPSNTEQPQDNLTQKNDILNNPITRGIQAVFPGKKVGEAIGTIGGLVGEKIKGMLGGQDNSKNYDTSAPTPLQVGGDVAQGALSIGAGLPEGTALNVFGKTIPAVAEAGSAIGRIGNAAKLGAGLGFSGGLAEGKTGLSDLGKSTGIGMAGGAVLGGVGEVVQKAAQSLPESIIRKFVPGLNEKTTTYAVNKGLGSPEKMLQESDSAISSLGKNLGDVLASKKYEKSLINPQEIVADVLSKFPESGLTPEEVWSEVGRLAKLKKGILTKLDNGESLSLKDAHSLNSTLGSNTFKTVFDDPSVKAGKDIGAAVYHSISDKIKSIAPESVPLFEQLSREYQLNPALRQVIRRGAKARTFTLRDLVALTSGFAAGGPIGAGTTLLAEKAVVNPTLNLKTAGLISSLGGSKAQAIGQSVKAPLVRGLVKLTK